MSAIADKAKRREQKPRACDLDPFLRFRAVGTNGQALVISSIKWNPRNEEQIAVSFLNSSKVKVYDVGGLSDTSSNSNGRSVPHINIEKSGESCGIKSIAFAFKRVSARVPGKENQHKVRKSTTVLTRLITGSHYGIVRLWTLPQNLHDYKCQSSSKIVWEYNAFQNADSGNSESIVDISLLGCDSRGVVPPSEDIYSGLVLVAGSNGSILLLDIQHCTKKAFSTSVTPTPIRKWSLQRMQLRMYGRPTTIKDSSILGIQQISVWPLVEKLCVNSKPNRSAIVNATLVNSDILIETKCGWLLRLEVAHQCRRNLSGGTANIASASLSIVHKIDATTFSRNRPMCRMKCGRLLAVASQSQTVAVASPRVEDRILVYRHERSPKDYEVMAPNLSIVNSCAVRNEEKTLVNISLRINPTAITSHPRSDWMIIGQEDGGLELLCLRRGKKFQKKPQEFYTLDEHQNENENNDED